jgi:hypothetical protein
MNTERIKSAITASVSTRGEYKGFLKQKQPPYGTDALAAWCAIMLKANPYKVSPFTLMMMDEERQEIFAAVQRGIQNLDVRGADTDRLILENLGAW